MGRLLRCGGGGGSGSTAPRDTAQDAAQDPDTAKENTGDAANNSSGDSVLAELERRAQCYEAALKEQKKESW